MGVSPSRNKTGLRDGHDPESNYNYGSMKNSESSSKNNFNNSNNNNSLVSNNNQYHNHNNIHDRNVSNVNNSYQSPRFQSPRDHDHAFLSESPAALPSNHLLKYGNSSIIEKSTNVDNYMKSVKLDTGSPITSRSPPNLLFLSPQLSSSPPSGNPVSLAHKGMECANTFIFLTVVSLSLSFCLTYICMYIWFLFSFPHLKIILISL